MSAERDVTRVVRSWLREDVHDYADRVLEIVLSRLDTTPQRRSFWPAWRSPMKSQTKALIAVAAVVVVAVVGYQFLPSRGGVGGTATPTPAPTPTPIVTPAPTAAPPAIPRIGALAPGRHGVTLEGIRFTLELPAGWISNGDFGIDKAAGIGPDGAGFIFWTEDANGVFADPCEQVRAPAAGPSAADLAAAIAAMPQIELVSGPTAVTIDGQPAQNVVVAIPDDIPCAPSDFYLWGDDVQLGQARYATRTGSTIRVWIIESDGARLQFDVETYAGAGPELDAEIQAIVDSIQFE